MLIITPTTDKMSEEIEMIKGTLDGIMGAVRTRDYSKVREVVENTKIMLDELKKGITPEQTSPEINEESLELEIYKKFHDEIKRKVRNSGKSNMISISEIDEDLIKTGNEIEFATKDKKENET